MISVNEIRNPEFTKTMMGGYKMEEVDELLSRVAEDIEALELEKLELVKKLKILGDRIEKYKSDEQYIQNALYDAQRIKKEADDSANAEAARIIEDAKKKSEDVRVALEREVQSALAENERVKAQARREADEIRKQADAYKSSVLAEVEQAKRNYIAIQSGIVEFRNTVIEAYKEHLNLVATLPSAESVKIAARSLDEKYPTGREGDFGIVSSVSEMLKKPVVNEVPDEEIESIIHKTLEFDIKDVKNSSKKDDIIPENTDTGEEAVKIAEPPKKEKRNDERARVKVVKSDRKNSFSYTSRTVEAKRTPEDGAPTVRLVDVSPDDLTASLRRRQAEKQDQ